MTVLGGAGLSVRQVAVPGRRLAVRRSDPAGKSAGPPVLLLHGVPETSACWQELLAEIGRDRIVLAPDLPGLGDSEVRGPYDVRSVAASLIALLAAELDEVLADPDEGDDGDADVVAEPSDGAGSVDERAHVGVDLVGHDWGGSLALAIAAARPDLVRRVVVISAPYRKVDLVSAWHIPLLGFVPPGLFSGAGRAVVRAMFRYAWRTGRLPTERIGQYAEAYAAPERVRAMAGYYRAAVRRRSRDGERAPAARPTRSLVIWGTDDPPMPLGVGEAVVSDLGAVVDPATVRMVTLPGVGHWPVEEVPDVVIPLIADFVRSD
jgi:haloacetate dehalogenase